MSSRTDSSEKLRPTLPLVASVVAIAVTATMDFTGYFMFSALPLMALILVFWLIQRQSRAEFGLVLGSPQDYLLALSYPALVLGAAALTAWVAGDISLAEGSWGNFRLNVLLGSTAGIPVLMLTEEGFFRGWLWGAFRKTGLNPRDTLIATSVMFSAWHISAVTSGTEYGLPWPQIPVYLANATLLGLIWGLLRLISGSIIVASLSHAVWNVFAYGLFGFGTRGGELGLTNTALFGPEVGWLGLVFNGLFFVWLYRKAKALGALAA